MGSVTRLIKKTKKAVTKPLSKAFKGIAKGIKKVGKATMRGVARINKKLGPLGSIALAVAMPYALSGLSTGFKALQVANQGNNFGTFLNAIGRVGNTIKAGYNGTTGFISESFSSITNSIANGFRRFAPESIKNTYSQISEGAKELFKAAKTKTQQFSPIKGKQGTIGVEAEALGLNAKDGIIQVDTSSIVRDGKLMVSPESIKTRTLGSDKWFVQGSVEADKIVTETINEAYKQNLKTFSPDTLRYFNDAKTKAINNKTYIDDERIGDLILKSPGTNKSYLADYSTSPYKIDTNLGTTGDYTALNEEGTEFLFNGNKSFGTGEKSIGFASKAKKATGGALKSLLKKKDTTPGDVTSLEFTFGDGSGTMTDITGTYGGTDITGAAGGNLLQGVYSDADRMKIMNYYKNMNILGSN